MTDPIEVIDVGNQRPTPEKVREKNLNPSVENPVQLQNKLIEPHWGSTIISPDLKAKIKRSLENPDGKTFSQQDMWNLFSYYKADLRLGYLTLQQEKYCQWYLWLAGEMLKSNHVKSFWNCLNKVASTLELSQSRGGFFRMNNQTIRQESQHVQVEQTDKKKSLFGSFTKVGG